MCIHTIHLLAVIDIKTENTTSKVTEEVTWWFKGTKGRMHLPKKIQIEMRGKKLCA